MSDAMEFPKTWEEFEKEYGFADKWQFYTDGSRLIQSLRVKQWLDHIKASKIGCEKMNENKMIWLGEGIYISYTNILMLTNYCEPQTKKIVKNAKQMNMLFDYSHGKSKKTVCVLKNGVVIVTASELCEVLRYLNNV